MRLKSPSARPCQHYCSTAAVEISRGVQGVSPPPSPAGATTSPAPVASPCTPPSTRRIDKKFPINKLLHCVLTLFFLSEKLPNSSLMHVFRWSLRLCSTQDEFLITRRDDPGMGKYPALLPPPIFSLVILLSAECRTLKY